MLCSSILWDGFQLLIRDILRQLGCHLPDRFRRSVNTSSKYQGYFLAFIERQRLERAKNTVLVYCSEFPGHNNHSDVNHTASRISSRCSVVGSFRARDNDERILARSTVLCAASSCNSLQTSATGPANIANFGPDWLTISGSPGPHCSANSPDYLPIVCQHPGWPRLSANGPRALWRP